MKPASLVVAALAVAGSLFLTKDAAAQKIQLSLTPAVITFPSSDPDAVPVVAAAPVQVTYRVQQNTGPWSLTVLAGGDLDCRPRNGRYLQCDVGGDSGARRSRTGH